jgi:ferredoxin
MNKPKINKNLCIGCSTCQNLCPKVFELGGDGKSHVLKADYTVNEDCIKRAAEMCPVKAIN